ncbi:hypothetical protein JTE90_025842 [Oedothorax gibbosus]|uniref:Ribosome-binding factor A, mitochondrial n=1 Tax=Oedothorax gibbosus TaxID=931172 RepID=A0AAV6UUG4_9ARAC|nr:hypothetical protein JTE90_025842 [Oedothorax gibbosus]
MSLFKQKPLSRALWLNIVRHKKYCQAVNTIHKRASMLSNMFENKDKRKTWHFEILQNNAKSRNVFEKVSRPHRRQGVLNSLFIQNISDVLSTGDVAPEILECGIEITGVKVSPCCKLLNVYWQVPVNADSSDIDIGLVLNQNASKLRAELISRNVMGRVPHIFFVRDMTNAHIAAFEKAMKDIDLGPKEQSAIVPDDTFVEDLYKFRVPNPERVKPPKFPPVDPPKKTVETDLSSPKRPPDMKTDLFGIDQKKLMDTVIAMKSKPKATPSNHVIVTSIGDPNADIFSQVPGTPFGQDETREEQLKKFHIARKKLRNKKTHVEREDNTLYADYFEDDSEVEPVVMEDFVEEDSAERF